MKNTAFKPKQIEVNTNLIDGGLKKMVIEYIHLLGIDNSLTQQTTTFDKDALKQSKQQILSGLSHSSGNKYIRFALNKTEWEKLKNYIKTNYDKQITDKLDELVPIIKTQLGI